MSIKSLCDVKNFVDHTLKTQVFELSYEVGRVKFDVGSTLNQMKGYSLGHGRFRAFCDVYFVRPVAGLVAAVGAVPTWLLDAPS